MVLFFQLMKGIGLKYIIMNASKIVIGLATVITVESYIKGIIRSSVGSRELIQILKFFIEVSFKLVKTQEVIILRKRRQNIN